LQQEAAWRPQAELAAAQSESAGQQRAVWALQKAAWCQQAALPELVRSSAAAQQARRPEVGSAASVVQAAALRPAESEPVQGAAEPAVARAEAEEVARQ
jgi:hypothetical protein